MFTLDGLTSFAQASHLVVYHWKPWACCGWLLSNDGPIPRLERCLRGTNMHNRATHTAAYGADLGNQIFVTLRRGEEWPPMTCDVRVRYEQTIGDIKKAVATALGVPVKKQQLFWHKKELVSDLYDDRTLLDMGLHTGFGLQGYDLSVPPSYWPQVKQGEHGLVIDC